MTRFTHSTTIDAGPREPKVTLRTQEELDHNLLANVVQRSLNDARSMLRTAQARLDNKNDVSARYNAKRFFLTDEKAIAAEDLALIKTIIGKTLTGLSCDITLKIGADVSRSGDAVDGAVSLWKGSDSRKPYHTEVASLGDNELYTRGAIRLEQEAVTESGRRGVRALIHEASHKYAGTIDYCYFSGPDGSKRDGPFTDKSQALINADSYGWFVTIIGTSPSIGSLSFRGLRW